MYIVRPIDIDQHPLVEQKYIVPTPSIDEFYDKVKRLVRLRIPGAIVHAYPRFGKTYSIRYVIRVLREDFPGIIILSFGCHKKKTPSEDAFFANLLRAATHKSPESGTVDRKRSRLTDRIKELVDKTRYNLVIAFADEAQRLDIIEYEWLRDVHDELERAGIRMITFLVGQPQLLNQKTAFREGRQTQIISRFMIDEMRFRGVLSPEDLAACLAGYDTACFPQDSDWTYTRFFFPLAYDDGLRLVDQARALWDAFERAHADARFEDALEIPMQYLSRAVEIAFLEHVEHDSPGFRFTETIWDAAVKDSNYVPAYEELRLQLAENFDYD